MSLYVVNFSDADFYYYHRLSFYRHDTLGRDFILLLDRVRTLARVYVRVWTVIKQYYTVNIIHKMLRIINCLRILDYTYDCPLSFTSFRVGLNVNELWQVWENRCFFFTRRCISIMIICVIKQIFNVSYRPIGLLYHRTTVVIILLYFVKPRDISVFIVHLGHMLSI